jgi:hypothetical protein
MSLVLLLAAAPAAGQAPAVPETGLADLPTWVVPVLRLVSDTHVEPTTGIVLSRDGLVLVPDDFAAFGDEIVVLDGGTDIVRNGRPARPHSAYPELGLEVLEVPGLSRSGAPLAAEPPAGGHTVRLQAFPPAEQIAEGAPPIEQAAGVILPDGSGSPAIAPTTPLPNVTGPLLDDCGNLAGISLAGGVQTMAPSAGTQYRWRSALRQVLEALQLPTAGVPCSESAPDEIAPTPPADPEAEEPPVVAKQEPEAPPSETAVSEPEPANSEPEETEPEIGLEELPPMEDDTERSGPGLDEPAEEAPSVPSWWWLAGGLLLVAGGLAVHRLRNRQDGDASFGEATASYGAFNDPASAPEADAGSMPPPPGPGFDSTLVLRGRYADGRSLEVEARVNAGAINLEIGRGSVDLALDSAAVSRRHARLNGNPEALTIADLGSSNGTSIDGVPCLEGEIMYLEPGCTVVVGDARFTVSIEPEPETA